MAKDAQSETVHAGSRSVGIDFDLNLWIYQLLEDNFYIDSGECYYDILPGWWTDARTLQSLQHANNLCLKDDKIME